MLKAISTTVVALVIAAIGSVVFYVLHLPLPWTLGALTAAAVVAIRDGRWLLQSSARSVVRPVIGVLIGSSFTAELVGAIGEWWPAVLLIIIFSLAMLGAGYFFFRRIAGFDGPTAFFAAAPGGLGELSLLGGSAGGDVRRLVIVHLIRILFVIFTIPFALQIWLGRTIGRTAPLAGNAVETLSGPDWLVLGLCAFLGYLISRMIRFPGGPMIFAMLLSMAVHVSGITQAAPPPWLVAAVQIVLGAVIGARFSGIEWNDVWRVVLIGAGWAFFMTATAAALAVIGIWILDRPFEHMLLAMAPAGMVEMSLIGLALGVDVAFVVTCQLCRILFVLILTPFFFRLLGISPPPGGQGPSSPAGPAM